MKTLFFLQLTTGDAGANDNMLTNGTTDLNRRGNFSVAIVAPWDIAEDDNQAGWGDGDSIGWGDGDELGW